MSETGYREDGINPRDLLLNVNGYISTTLTLSNFRYQESLYISFSMLTSNCLLEVLVYVLFVTTALTLMLQSP